MQYGTFDNFSYGVSGNYYSDPGQYPDNDLLSKSLSLTVKLGLTPQDDIYGEVNEVRRNGGNTSQYYDPYIPWDTRFNETQDPILTVGYHHEWQPGVHSLVYASRFQSDLSFNSSVGAINVVRYPGFIPTPGGLASVLGNFALHADYQSTLTLYTTEAQQIFEQDTHTTILGGRYQYGAAETQNLENNAPDYFLGDFFDPVAQQDVNTTMRRFSVYGYHYWQIFEPLQLIGGFSYDWLNYPENLISLPVSSQNDTAGQLSPKAGFIWTPLPGSTVRFAYTKSLGSEDLDQSQRIEPTQVAGFQQTFRSLIGDPSVTQNALAKDETFGLSLEQKFSTGTYLGLSGEILKSKFNQSVGVLENVYGVIDPNNPYDYANPGSLEQSVKYHEESLQFTINQLLGRDWALGGQYRLSYAKLTSDYPEVSAVKDQLYLGDPYYPFDPYQAHSATLNQIYLYAIYNLPCGFFSQADTRWYSQNNTGYSGSEPGDSFWQFDAFVGWRFWHRTAEVSVGLLNITDQNYQLNPLNAYSDLPRERTFVARFKFNF